MLDSFSKTYIDARSKFLGAATEIDATLSSIAYVGSNGPNDEELFIDIASVGCAQPTTALVVISGTHGVEGFCGSACQVSWLKHQYSGRAMQQTVVYFIHALNPYGFAWYRRVTPTNIDLNRNFLESFDGALPDNPQYAALDALLNPKEPNGEGILSLPAELLAKLQSEQGVRDLKAAVGMGQYAFPEGIIFGGQSPDQSNRILREFIGSLPKTIRMGVVLDFHTGLGQPGALEIFTEESSTKFFAMRQWFAGRKVTTLGDEGSLGYRIHGSVYRAFTEPNAQTPWHCAALEFGSKPLPLVLAALRADNWLHASAAGSSPMSETIQSRMADAFAIADENKASVVNTGLAVIDEALHALRLADQ